MEFSSDDYKYGGFGQIYHMTYPVKEFDGQRYVELYIPARTAIVLRETKEDKPAPEAVPEQDPVPEAAPEKKPAAKKPAAKKPAAKKTTKKTAEK